MNKKNSLLVVLSMVFSIESSFAAEGMNKVEQERYEAIVKAFSVERNEFDASFIPSGDDIRIVQEHKANLETQLIEKKKVFESTYVPLLLKLGGGITLVPAVLAGTVATVGAVGSSYGLGSGGDYLGFLNIGYRAIFFNRFGFGSSLTKDEKNRGGEYIRAISHLSPNSESMVGPMIMVAGIAAPPVAMGALVLGGISRYLFKKAASYKNEIITLEKDIDRDAAIIKALEAFKK